MAKHKVAPVRNSLMIFAIVGLLISVFGVIKVWLSMGVAFIIVFAVIFAASLVSMTKEPMDYDEARARRTGKY